MSRMKSTVKPLAALTLATLLMCGDNAQADSVAQVQTAKRISRSTVVLIDPQGRPGMVPGNSDTAAEVGDILTFVIQFTPVPNGSTRGLGGYVTDYIPRNTEVVGARIVDRDGNTVPPHRGGLSADGVGPRGPGDFTNLPEGSLSQLYADTGIFFSTDPLTTRVPDGSVDGEAFLSLFNGIEMNPEPTGVGQLDTILGAGNTTYAHNLWDWTQALAFGVNGGAIGDGNGNTPHLYGSPVAGPDTWYPNEATFTGAMGTTPTIATVAAMGNVGPWQRIRTVGAETGRAGAVPDANGDMPDPGLSTRVGVPAVDNMGQPLGVLLSPTTPLPSYDPAQPNQPYTRAVRFALGELVVGEEYFAEISLRVKALPLDPIANMDVNCAEVFGGDASAQEADGSKGGKDNAWRYFLPAPSCVVLNNFFELSVDKIAALDGERVTYTLEGKNLSRSAQPGVVVRQCFPDNLDFVSASNGGMLDNSGTGCPLGEDSVVWNVGNLAAGDGYVFTTEFDISGGVTALSRAIYTSTNLPDPGFQVVAMTNIRAISVLDIDATAAPSSTSAGSDVHYTVEITNNGTGLTEAAGNRVMVTLPAGFTYKGGTTAVQMMGAADPGIVGTVLEFTDGLVDIAPGATLTIEFDVTVGAAVTPGAYTIDAETWFKGAAGKNINDAEAQLAEVLVDIQRTTSPVVAGPLTAGATMVRGSAEANATIEILVNGVVVATAMADAAGAWSATLPELFGGQQVTARAQAGAKLDSLESAPPVTVTSVGGATACNNGVDDDNDGLIDFPADPGCESANDVDETDVPECSDGLDNDNDGNIDFPDDPKCASFRDDSEGGMPECSDGVDNDNDGQTDTDDTDCADGNGNREAGATACADGADNDNDGLADYPFDPGCSSALDDDETNEGVMADMGTETDMGTGDVGELVDPGGFDGPAGSSSGAAEDDGCGCRKVGGQRHTPWAIALLALGLLGFVRRRRIRASS